MDFAMMNKDQKAAVPATDQYSRTGPLLVFVLGAPCSGKSTLCAALAERYNLDHFSLGDELRSLVSDTPSGHAARIKALFSDSELEIFRSNLHAGTLGPAHLTPKYVKERVFHAGCDLKSVRTLIDGFPRDAQRWESFVASAKPCWTPSQRSLLIVLDVEEAVALERFTKRGRRGDIFGRRFRKHTETVTGIVEAMQSSGLAIHGMGKESEDLETMVESVAHLVR